MKTIGIILLVGGILMTIFTGVNLVTKEEEVVDLGIVEINKKENNPIYWSPITGGVLAVIGAIVLVAGKKKG
ncbi:hypothetical protein AWW67_12715 [Roseivirga seohaensis]|uniref:DUF3185 domain-containing protein n=1 Tax=Roseivirga seohaensis TaxID=1914963 RepID=A0A150XKJ2_9BACT|nr:hypothetical protein [Roseivirga seohaensis]KYG79236.1 hypothetical protein AWW67_12715 [Roseivirga seohaensis]